MKLITASPVLAVRDLARSSQWFADIFDCTLTPIDDGNWIFASNGAVTFMLGSCPDERPASEIGMHSYLAYIVVDDINAVYERAQRHGGQILSAPKAEPWGRTEMAIQAPEGHRFMVAQ